MDKRILKLRQLDKALATAVVPLKPRSGWIKAIREALGMTTRQLSERLQIAQSAIVAMEKSEASETIAIQTLRRAAEAMDCELHYVLVPRKPLSRMVDQQAEKTATSEVGASSHTMALESQSTNSSFASNLIEDTKRKILAGKWSGLW
jgi:predicted DNA-binding mobile mystery protein A